MCFGGWLIQDLGNDSRSPIMCFDFGGLKIQEGFSTASWINSRASHTLHTHSRCTQQPGVALRIQNMPEVFQQV